MIIVILSIILCAAVSVLISTVITCKVTERITHGAFEYLEKAMDSLYEENRP